MDTSDVMKPLLTNAPHWDDQNAVSALVYTNAKQFYNVKDEPLLFFLVIKYAPILVIKLRRLILVRELTFAKCTILFASSAPNKGALIRGVCSRWSLGSWRKRGETSTIRGIVDSQGVES